MSLGAGRALTQMGQGLLAYSVKQEDLKYQRERDENLAALQREENAATAKYREADLELKRTGQKSDADYRTATLEQSADEAASTAAYREGTLAVQREQNKATLAKEGLMLNDEGVVVPANEETREWLKEYNTSKRSAAGSPSATTQVFDRELSTLRMLRDDDKNPDYVGKTDAELREIASRRAYSVRADPTQSVEVQIDDLQKKRTALEKRLESQGLLASPAQKQAWEMELRRIDDQISQSIQRLSTDPAQTTTPAPSQGGGLAMPSLFDGLVP